MCHARQNLTLRIWNDVNVVLCLIRESMITTFMWVLLASSEMEVAIRMATPRCCRLRGPHPRTHVFCLYFVRLSILHSCVIHWWRSLMKQISALQNIDRIQCVSMQIETSCKPIESKCECSHQENTSRRHVRNCQQKTCCGSHGDASQYPS